MAIHYYSQQQLVENGKFSQSDLEKINLYRGKPNRLGFAYQIIYVRLLSYFPQQKPCEIIDEVLSFSALQLGFDSKHITEYRKHRQHIARHQEHIRCYLNLTSFSEKTSNQLCEFLFEESKRIEQTILLLQESKQFLRS